MDVRQNFGYSTIQNTPSTGGTSFIVETGHGTRFLANTNVVVCPLGERPTVDNAEVVRITGISTDTLTVTRAQEGTSAVDVDTSYQVFDAITKKDFDDIETEIDAATYNWLGEWANATAYSVNDVVKVTAGQIKGYICTTAHTSATANDKPGSGTNWTTYWDLYQEPVQPNLQKSATFLTPGASESITFMHTEVAITIAEIRAVVQGSSTPSVTVQIYHDTNISGASNTVLTSATAITNTTVGQSLTSFNDATVPADSWLIFVTTAQSGVVDSVTLAIRYTED